MIGRNTGLTYYNRKPCHPDIGEPHQFKLSELKPLSNSNKMGFQPFFVSDGRSSYPVSTVFCNVKVISAYIMYQNYNKVYICEALR